MAPTMDFWVLLRLHETEAAAGAAAGSARNVKGNQNVRGKVPVNPETSHVNRPDRLRRRSHPKAADPAARPVSGRMSPEAPRAKEKMAEAVRIEAAGAMKHAAETTSMIHPVPSWRRWDAFSNRPLHLRPRPPERPHRWAIPMPSCPKHRSAPNPTRMVKCSPPISAPPQFSAHERLASQLLHPLRSRISDRR